MKRGYIENKERCEWPSGDELMIRYHDEEWGVPLHDNQKLFEFLLLEGFQAGLNWRTILYKRQNFRKAFDNFNPNKIANYNKKKINSLMMDSGIIRNKLKIESTIKNAKAYLEVKKEFGSFDKYIWQFAGGEPIKNNWKTMKQIPAITEKAKAMSKDLLKRGFKFVGPTICYAYMQAIGVVNDHTVNCFRHKELK